MYNDSKSLSQARPKKTKQRSLVMFDNKKDAGFSGGLMVC